MDPLVALLMELGARAKTAEARCAALDGVIADLNKKIEELTPKTAEPPKES